MGLDRNKKPLRSVASGPGHCLGTGIIDDSLVPRVATRLFEPDLWSGWGIRTLSSRHPAFNPFSYHRGSVWPVEQAELAGALASVGFHERASQLAAALFEVAALFEHHRLPEVFGGQGRDSTHPFPALYPRSNWPQAWSCSAVLEMMRALLGIRPDAARRRLVVDPHLPDWLPAVSIEGLELGGSIIDLDFRKGSDTTHCRARRASGASVQVQHRPA